MAEIVEFPNPIDEQLKTLISLFIADPDKDPEIYESYLSIFSQLIALPDEAFISIAPGVLENLDRSFRGTEAKLTFSYLLSKEDKRAEDLLEDIKVFAKMFEQSLKDQLSDIKINFFLSIFGIIYNAISDNENLAKRTVMVHIQKIHPDAKLPTYAHITDSGMDVYALEDIEILPGETKLIPLGIKCALPKGYELQVRPKSGLSLRTHLRFANCVGTIDEGYKDEICLIIENNDNPINDISYHFTDKGEIIIDSILHGSPLTIGKGQKIGQLVLAEVPKVVWNEVADISLYGSEDRKGGFGSTGAY